MTGDRYDASVANIRDTVKWLIGSIGAVFVTLLAGVQFNHVPFTSDSTAAAAGAVASLSLMFTFFLAIRTLVGGSVSFDELAKAWRLWPTRRFIDRIWGGSPQSGIFRRFQAALQNKDLAIKNGTLAKTDPKYLEMTAQVEQLLGLARWHIVKWRFNLLVGATMLLVPIELAAAGVMFSRPDPEPAETTITIQHRHQP